MNISSFSMALTRRRPLTPVKTMPSTRFQSSSSGERSDCKSDEGENHNCDSNRRHLKRTLALHDVVLYGVGCSVGAGIYSLVGIGANLAGPAIALSFLLCGTACVFTSLSYAEFASRVPLAGSAYTFTYVSFGELAGWLVGWNLTLGYAVSAAVVARSWAEYVAGFLSSFLGGDKLWGSTRTAAFLNWITHAPVPSWFRPLTSSVEYTCCPLAAFIIGLCTYVLVTGAKESTRFNNAMTVLNLSVLAFVVFAGVASGTVDIDNLTPTFPHGVSGMARGAGLVFFSYLGFDMVSCLSEEVANPERNMPIGIIGSLLASMSIYVGVSIVVVGMAPVTLLGEDVPIVNALLANACCSHEEHLDDETAVSACLDYSACQSMLHTALYYGSRVVSFGAIFGLTAATFACLMGQPRIFYSMAQDGLIFRIYGRVNPQTGVPTAGTILTGFCTALVACFVDLESLANAISLGTLQVFTFVNAGVILLRTRPPLTTMTKVVSTSLTASSAMAAVDSNFCGDLPRSPGNEKSRWKRMRSELLPRSVEENGSRPIHLTLAFTAAVILASMASSSPSSSRTTMITIASCFYVLVALVAAIFLTFLPQNEPPHTFQCPFVPTVPLFGILCNSYMMGSMPWSAWFAVMGWLTCGLIFYFAYGIRHSELRGSTDGGGRSANGAAAKEATCDEAMVSTPLMSEATTEEGYDSIFEE